MFCSRYDCDLTAAADWARPIVDDTITTVGVSLVKPTPLLPFVACAKRVQQAPSQDRLLPRSRVRQAWVTAVNNV
jgi:hypothetical protein